jgi:hypothetical protein
LVRLLNFTLGPAYRVDGEVAVGEPPLYLDILLIRREQGELSEVSVREILELLPLLSQFTLIEFKGPTDAMKWGDFARLVGCSYLWLSQLRDPVPHQEVSLVVVAPAVNAPLRDELRQLGFEIKEREPGIFQVTGLPFATWLVETDVMAERGQPVLSLVSRAFLNDRRSIIELFARRGHTALANYRYMVQQVKQFRREEELAMQQAISENLEQFEEELFDKMLEEASPERRLRGLAPEERLRGLAPEELAAALSEEQAARLIAALQRKQGR